MSITLPAVALVAAWILLYFRIEPVATWFYVFAWYPTLLLLVGILRRSGRGERPLQGAAQLASLFGWSVVVWLLYEAANFRLDNWYYVFLPHGTIERWAGILLSFATVLPALFLAERVLRALEIGTRVKARPASVTPVGLRLATTLGVVTLAMALIWPRTFFPLCWGAALLIADPFVYRRRPELSLIADVERGDWGRVVRLMLGGSAIGFIWEGYNYWARGKWIYTVPWLEDTKWFEMPPFGFLGFPVFALSAWALYHGLCAIGVATPLGSPSRIRRARTALAAIVAVAFAYGTLTEMDRSTVSSTVPALAHLPGVSDVEVEALRRADIRSPFELARRGTNAAALAVASGLGPERAGEVLAVARLATLQGIGARHAGQLETAGIRTVCDLARADPHELWLTIHALFRGSGRRPTDAEVRVWWRAAGRECGKVSGVR